MASTMRPARQSIVIDPWVSTLGESFAMQFRYGHLADYAGEALAGKLTLVGIFEFIMANDTRPIVLPLMHVAAVFEAHVTEGTQHQLEIRFTNADGVDQIPPAQVPMAFTQQGPGRPLRGNVVMQLLGIAVPDIGDYAFSLFVDGRLEGSIPLAIVPQIRPATGPRTHGPRR